MPKTRRSIYLENDNYEKLADVIYAFRKENKQRATISEIVNKLIENKTSKEIIAILAER